MGKKIIIVGRNDHSRYVADQYNKKGYLYRYYSYYFWKPTLFGKIVKFFKPNIVKINKGIVLPLDKVKSFPIVAILIRFLDKIKFPLLSRTKLYSELYDFYMSYVIEKDADYYHIWSQFGLRTIKAIRKKNHNSKIIIDLYCALPKYREKIYSKNKLMKNFKISESKINEKIIKELEICDYIICPSQHVYDSICDQMLDIKRDKIKIIPFGSEMNNFYPILRKENEYLEILYVGQISLHKGVNYLIESLDELVSEGYKINLTLIGNKSKYYKNKIYFGKNTKYLGIKKNHELNAYYNKADIFVLPSLSESFGLVTLESLRAGVPAIVTKNAVGFIKDGINGLIINENSKKELKEAIIKVYQDRNLLSELKKCCKVKLEYKWEDYVKRIEKEIL